MANDPKNGPVGPSTHTPNDDLDGARRRGFAEALLVAVPAALLLAAALRAARPAGPVTVPKKVDHVAKQVTIDPPTSTGKRVRDLPTTPEKQR